MHSREILVRKLEVFADLIRGDKPRPIPNVDIQLTSSRDIAMQVEQFYKQPGALGAQEMIEDD